MVLPVVLQLQTKSVQGVGVRPGPTAVIVVRQIVGGR